MALSNITSFFGFSSNKAAKPESTRALQATSASSSGSSAGPASSTDSVSLSSEALESRTKEQKRRQDAVKKALDPKRPDKLEPSRRVHEKTWELLKS